MPIDSNHIGAPPWAQRRVDRMHAVVVVAVFATMCAHPSSLSKLPLRALLKDSFGMGPEAMAWFFGAVGLAWYIKPLAALWTDHVPLNGTRRRSYMLVASIGAVGAWSAAAVSAGDPTALLATMIALNGFAVLGNTAVGGLLVDIGRTAGADRLSARRELAMNLATLLGGIVGGWLAGWAFGWTCLVGAALMLVMTGVVWARADAEAPPAAAGPRSWPAILRDAAGQVRRPELWSVILLTAVFYAAPGFASLFYYYQRDVLELTDPTIGLLGGLYYAGGALGAACYGRVCELLPFSLRLPLGIGLSGASALLYLFYDSLAAAVVLEPLIGMCVALGVLPLVELTVRASPPRHEALGFAVILGVGNAGLALSDILGATLASRLGLGLGSLIGIYAVITAASAGLLRWVPEDLRRPPRTA